jgi:hypothetical protein
VLTADTYTSVLTDLLAYAAEATARLVLAAAAYAISKCRLMLSGDALRQGCRSHMDHASIARSVLSRPAGPPRTWVLGTITE